MDTKLILKKQKLKSKSDLLIVLALLVLISLAIIPLTGCSGPSGKDAGDPAGQDADGRWQEDNLQPDGDGTGGENGNAGMEDGKNCGRDENPGPEGSHDPYGPGSIPEIIDKMSLDEKIGQMFMIGVEGTSVGEDLKNLITSRKPGGIILFRDNITGLEQLTDFINELKSANFGNIPLFLSVDEEGGRISRLPQPLKELPSAMSVGEAGDEAFSREIGRLLAAKVEAFGFNMDLAPVLDIFSNPANTVIGDRAYGYDPLSVARHGLQVMRGLREEGIIAVIKHFPGHGDTDVDSHLGLPAVEHDRERLAGFELVPFRKAIEEGAEAVMVAHILVTSLDPELPASLSPAVISGLLREEMGFDGVVITDDLTMRAITDNYGIGEAAVKSVIAGNDILLVCHGQERQAEAMDAVAKAVEEGIIDEARIDGSVERILKLKAKYGLCDDAAAYPDVDGLNEKIEGVLSKWYNSKWYNDN